MSGTSHSDESDQIALGVNSSSTMIYTAIDTFYLTDEQLQETPSRKDGIDEATETTLRIYGCDLIQESGILLKVMRCFNFSVMSRSVDIPVILGMLMAHTSASNGHRSGSVPSILLQEVICPFQREGMALLSVDRIAGSCVWLASKLEENHRRARHVINVFHRMERRRENLPIEHMDAFSKIIATSTTDSQIHNNIMAAGSRDRPPMLATGRYAQWRSRFLRYIDTRPNGDALRKYILEVETVLNMSPANRAHFESEKEAIHLILTGIGDEIYSTIDACKTTHKMWEAIERLQQGESLNIQDEGPSSDPPMLDDTNTSKVSPAAVNPDSKDVLIKAGSGRLQDSTKSDDDTQGIQVEGDMKDEPTPKNKEHRIDTSRERSRDREREREREKDKYRGRDRDRGRDSDREREREDLERDREKVKDRSHRSKDRGHAEKLKNHPSRDRDYHGSSYSSREKERHRHHSYG
ncbi:cyclin-L1-1 [Tanacetum coccineum]|uniref:Cyclin-L1-1 n=1 Tax=Tanacetum coccineum TaxID=301880 RepID=A0ABQ5B4B5_9ASTR